MTTSSQALRPYVPTLVADWLREAPEQLRLEVEGTLVFADLSGFTALAERLARMGREGAEELTAVIDEVFSELITTAARDGGQLLSFGGDALLLHFDGDAHAQRAAHAAHAIRSVIRSSGQRQTGAGRVRLRVSIGVHSGLFQMLLVGRLHRLLVLVGDHVTRTVLTEASAHAGDIALSPQTAAALAKANVRERNGLQLLRGEPPPSSTWFSTTKATDADERSLVGGLPPLVRDHLESTVDILQHRSATVGFARVEDLDRRMRSDPDGTTQALNDVVSAVQDACQRHGACALDSDIDKDAIKLVITAGVPSTSGDDEERLLLVARSLVDADLPLPLRVGINRGTVFAGSVGSTRRRTYTVMGDTVNLAARVMAAATTGRVLATNDVVDRSRLQFDTRPVEPFTVKGKTGLIHAVEIGRPNDSAPATANTSSLSVVGRQRELDALRHEWHEVNQRSQARFVELVGEPGIGKSTIVERFVDETTTAENKLRLRGDLYTRTTPYRGLASLLQIACGLAAEGQDVDAQLRQLGEQLPESSRAMLPLLNDVLQSSLAPTPASTALTDEPRRVAVAAIATEVLSCSLTRPTLIVLEDTHWFDDATSEWLTYLTVHPPPLPWFLVSTRRSVDGGFNLEASAGRSLEVLPLGEEAARELIQTEREGLPTPPQLVKRLSERAAGNPLYLRELVRSLGTDGDLEALPDSLDALLTARIDRLDPGDRHLVCRASVLGQRFQPELLTTVLDETSARPTPTVLARVADFLTAAPGGRLGFSHALIRDAAYQLLPYRLRRTLHGQVAERLASGANPDASVLSFHYFAAQHWEPAWHTSRQAADTALASHAPVEAAELLERAVQSGRRVADLPASTLVSTGLELSRAYERSGQFESAERNYRSLSRLPVDPLDRARLKVQLAWLAERRSNLPLAIRRARAAVSVIDKAEVRGKERDLCYAEARTVEGMALEVMGRHADAATVLQEAVDIAMRHGAKRAEAQAASILDWSLAMSGSLEEPANLRRALELYRSIDDVPGEAACLANLGGVAYMSGQWEAAVDYYRRGQEAHARSGDETSAALGAANTAEVLSDQGYWTEALSLLEEALAVWRATGHEHGVAYALGLLGRTHSRAARFGDGLAALTESRERHSAIGAKADAAQVWLWMAEAHALSGDPRKCDEVLKGGANDGSITARRIAASALGLRSPVDGIAALVTLREGADSKGEAYEQVVIDHTLAALEPERATEHLRASQMMSDRLGISRIAAPMFPT